MCAIIQSLLLLNDFVDLDLGKFLTVAVQFLEALAADLLENEHLVCLYIVCEHGCLNNSAFNIGSTDFDLALDIDEEHFVKLYFCIFSLRKTGNENLVSGLYLELATCNVYNCVHKKNFFKVLAASGCSRNSS